MPFYFSKASSNGTRLNSGDTQLTPAPTYVVYPAQALGAILETMDGLPVVQQLNKDGRQRQWVWTNYRESINGYVTLWNNLLALRSRTLKEQGAKTPYVYLKEDITHRLRRKVTYNGTATGGSTNTLIDSGNPFPGSNALAGYIAYIIDGQGAGQQATVVTNTTSTLTFASSSFTNAPNTTSKYSVVGWVDDWFRCRVIDVQRKLRDEPGNPPAYDTTTLTFCIDDQLYNDIG